MASVTAAKALYLFTATSSACRQPQLPPLLCLGFFLLLPLAIPLPGPAPCRASQHTVFPQVDRGTGPPDRSGGSAHGSGGRDRVRMSCRQRAHRQHRHGCGARNRATRPGGCVYEGRWAPFSLFLSSFFVFYSSIDAVGLALMNKWSKWSGSNPRMWTMRAT